MKKKVRVRSSAGSGAQKPKTAAPDLREKQRKLNEGRTHEFSLDKAGHFILVSYQPASQRLTGRSRTVVFDSNLPDPAGLEYKTTRRLYEAAAALSGGAIKPELRSWLGGALQRLADQVNQPKPDWDARTAFEMRQTAPQRSADTTWMQPFIALDVEFGRASGQTVEDATEAAADAWQQSYGAVEKLHEKWSKVSRKVVKTVKREDAREGMSATDSAADHLAGLRLFQAEHAVNDTGRPPKKRRA